MATNFYFCMRSGRIDKGRSVPKGAIPICRSTRERTARIHARARLSRKDNETMFVPGVPEAEDDRHALEAVETFVRWIVYDEPPRRETRKEAIERSAGR